MVELESVIEQNLIDKLAHGESQWTYRPDLNTEEKLWANLRHILEMNNKDILNGKPLTDTEFAQVKNQLSFPSFYAAAQWIAGENGIAHVNVQRDTETVHLTALNRAHKSGGSSVYEVINQYQAFGDDDDNDSRDRRFDVSLLINGIPLIHIELKNQAHSYMDAFRQTKKYVREGKFTGIFSAVQMFVVSNAVNTKYIAASDKMNEKFLTGWCDAENNVVANYLDFADAVLRIPEAHQMVTQYTVMDSTNRNLIILRPYQIHAIECVGRASCEGKSGFIWHTTGTGKTLESYKTARNLLLDIPSIDKTIFLVDRKDLDNQTSLDFRAYAENDIINVDGTDNVTGLKKELKSPSRKVIVTTRQKLDIIIKKRLPEDSADYKKIRNLRIAFVVDECHRTISPSTKRNLERFFVNSLWYGFTGTPRFGENAYPASGDLPRTTEELYGEPLHVYTVREAIHDEAVLGFQAEHLGPTNLQTDDSGNNINENMDMYLMEEHMLSVLDVILNKSSRKWGFQNGSGRTYEAILTVGSIKIAQRYYKLLKDVVEGKKDLKIREEVKRAVPDFPKFAITYSLTENEEKSSVNQEEMNESLHDYNEMFGTTWTAATINGYNEDLNNRLARKREQYFSRSEQLDLVIVVDRLLTGFNAPCLSTLFMDRQPMQPHDIIQSFSRTNRIFDKNKPYGYIVTFQSPGTFRNKINEALVLYSRGGEREALAQEYEEVETAVKGSVAKLHMVAPTPDVIPSLSDADKKRFLKAFSEFDKDFFHIKSFTAFDGHTIEEYGMSEEDYEAYVAHYKNVREQLREEKEEMDDPDPVESYELMSYEHEVIDYEYITSLIQIAVDETDEDKREKLLNETEEYIRALSQTNEKLGNLMMDLLVEIRNDTEKYQNEKITVVLERMRASAIDRVLTAFADKWYLNDGALKYVTREYRVGAEDIPGLQSLKDTSDYGTYKTNAEHPVPKFKYYSQMSRELRTMLNEEIVPLRDRA